MRDRFAILIPYRDRAHHLTQLILRLEDFLRSTPHDIYVVEQHGERPFNKGKLLNAGFQCLRDFYSYFVFHDVDQLPLEADYSRPSRGPVHLGGHLSQYGFRLPYAGYFGGVVVFTPRQFQRVNGFSNQYWGWGCEDDDLHRRCQSQGLRITRRKGRFVSLSHARDYTALERARKRLLSFRKQRAEKDGLGSLRFKVRQSGRLRGGPVLLGRAGFRGQVRRIVVEI